MLAELIEWISNGIPGDVWRFIFGDLPSWIGTFLTLGGGVAVGGYQAALARARLEDRREILALVLEMREDHVQQWNERRIGGSHYESVRIRELNALARRLPHFERFAAIKMILLWVQVSAWVEAHEEPHLAPKPDNWDANPFHLLDQRSEFVGYLEQAVNPRLLARVDNWWKRVKFRAEWLWQMNIKGMTTESTLGALRELDEAEKSEPPSAGWYLTKTGLRKLDQSSPRRTAGDDQVG